MTQPTFYQVNEFIYPFQEVTVNYGVQNYKEINPTIMGAVTFPFLFGVMFGDVFHGFLLFSFGTYLCLAERKPGSMIETFLPFRYMVLLMGFFATYCGFMYNDMTSITLNVFGESCYNIVEQSDGSLETEIQDECVYPFGMDPIWYISGQDITILNSLKMKISVIIGVIHMLCGTVFKAMNARFKQDYIEIFFVVVPQIVLMCCLFGFMDLMIIKKWLTDWSDPDAGSPPSITTMMVDMGINFGASSTGDANLFGSHQP
jgi:V-type H+-transporting ATPase subunit a